MSDWELLRTISEIPSRENKPVPEKLVRKNEFIEYSENLRLKEIWKSSSYSEWEWHQVARFAFQDSENQRYMYEKLWDLINKHRNSYDDYFELTSELGTFLEPNPLTRLNKLTSLYDEYFEIFSNITRQMHFDFPTIQYVGPSFRGTVNWDKTFKNSNSEFPTTFVSQIPLKKFDTPGNILLFLSCSWLHKECSRILNLEFFEPLDATQIEILENIYHKTNNLIINFPFSEVVKASMPFWKVPHDSKSVLELERKSSERISKGIVKNAYYQKLLDWIQTFRNMNLNLVSEETPSNKLLRNIDSQDTIYEAWMFFEFVDYFSKQEKLIDLHMDNENKSYWFTFDHNGNELTWHYDLEFSPKDKPQYTWAWRHKPDFTIMKGDEIIAICDAKNFSQKQSAKEGVNKMMAYMTNFNAKIGILLFPYIPTFWDDYEPKRKRNMLIPTYKKAHPEFSHEKISSMQKPESNLNWEELPKYLKQKFKLNSFDDIQNPKDSEMHLVLMRMEPARKNTALLQRQEVMEQILSFLPEQS